MSLEERYRWEKDSWCFGSESTFRLDKSQPLLFGYQCSLGTSISLPLCQGPPREVITQLAFAAMQILP